MFDINKIRVYRNINNTGRVTGKVIVENPQNQEMIGRGYQGAVFKYSDDKCIKVFARICDAKVEAEVYKSMKDNAVIPKLFGFGENFIIIEYIKGVTLDDYLWKKGYISTNITRQMLDIIRNTKYKNYNLTDVQLDNIIVDKDENLKLIDLGEILSVDERPSFLFKVINDMKKLNSFLEQVKQFDYSLFKTWEISMREYKNIFDKIREKEILDISNKAN